MDEFKFEVWPTEFRSITQQFGANPQNYAQFGLPGHEGIDFTAPHRTKIFVVAPGRVHMVQNNPDAHPYGKHVRVAHRDGYQTIYAHLDETSVQVGQEIEAGHVIGLADNTGNSFGSHLHLSLKKEGAQIGNWPAGFIDPTPFILPLMGWRQPAGPYTEGWAYTAGIVVQGELAQINTGGINLRRQPSVNADMIDLVPGGTIVIVTGAARGLYTPVQVPSVTLSNVAPTETPEPDPPPSPSTETVDGWGWANYLTVRGNQAVVGEFGINLRAAPSRGGANIGLVKGGSTVTVTGGQRGEYLSVQVRKTDFSGPVSLPESAVAPAPTPSAGAAAPSDGVMGWAWTQNLTISGNQAISGQFGSNLRSRPQRTGVSLGTFNEGAAGTIVGKARGEYTPVLVRPSDISKLVSPLPAVEQPDPLPESAAAAPDPTPEPIEDTTPGWAFTSQITAVGGMGHAGQYGINLRAAPRRDAKNLGFVPPNASMIVTGDPKGEYTPVRIDDDVLQDPIKPGVVSAGGQPQPVVDPDPLPLGAARIGLHASADPDISSNEIDEFKLLRPGIIKLLSFHNPNGVRQLAANHPDVSWIVRAFLSFGGRNISPAQFVNDTISDMRRTLGYLQGKDVIIELHNEPNLVPEGLGSSWSDGASFARWWLEVLDKYRTELPGMRFMYPGLSPGASVAGIKQDHIEFIEASRDAVKAADGLGVHIYWSNVYPMETALGVLDDYISRFRQKPIWITEASNNKGGVTPTRKGREYLTFWQELQKRSAVQGVTYFVASASDATFAEEVWVGRGIARVVGER